MPEKNEKLTTTFVTFRPFKDWAGETTYTRVKVPSPGNFKPELYIPVPTTDEECQKYYGMKLSDLIAKGATQQVYDVSEDIKGWFVDRMNEHNCDVDELKKFDVPTDLFIKIPKPKKIAPAPSQWSSVIRKNIRPVDGPD